MKTKTLLFGAVVAATLVACATTTSPTGRKQYVGAVSQEQLNQLGAQSFAQMKTQKAQTTSAAPPCLSLRRNERIDWSTLEVSTHSNPCGSQSFS